MLLFYLVTGSFPLEAGTMQELRAAHHESRTRRLRDVRPDLPEPFIHVVERALAADCHGRIESAGRFEAELSSVLGQIDRDSARSARAWRWALAAGTVVMFAVVLVMTWQRPRIAHERTESAASAGRSIAVLPFVNRSGSAEDDYFADGMTDELIAALGKVPGLHVAARTSAFSFKGQSTEVREMARKLGVDSVLEGTVRRSGQRLRVTASLVSASDGLQRWSSTFENADGDAFAVQDDITRAVVSDLSLRLGGMALLASQAGRTKDSEAHDLSLARARIGQRSHRSRSAPRLGVLPAGDRARSGIRAGVHGHRDGARNAGGRVRASKPGLPGGESGGRGGD